MPLSIHAFHQIQSYHRYFATFALGHTRLSVLRRTARQRDLSNGTLHRPHTCRDLWRPVPGRRWSDDHCQGPRVVLVCRPGGGRCHGFRQRAVGRDLRGGRIQHTRQRSRLSLLGPRQGRVRAADLRPGRWDGPRWNLCGRPEGTSPGCLKAV